MNKVKKCKKCGKPKMTLRIEISLCGCPLDSGSEKLLRSLLEENEKKKRLEHLLK